QLSEPWSDPFEGAALDEARVTEVLGTRTRVQSQPVVEVRFEWPARAPQHAGRSYSEGRAPSPGETLPVEWVAGDPPQARLVGMRTAEMPRWVRLTLVLPAVGVLLLLGALRAGLGRVRLLRQGLEGQATCVARRPTRQVVNGQPVQALTFRLVDARGLARDVQVRTHRVERLTDGATERVLYAAGGQGLLLWDALPVEPIPDGQGGFAPATLAQLAPGLVLPTLLALAWSAIQPLLALAR
ncbi:MAG: hypothetical protein ACKOSS_09480, partial [Planctomycetia bacterium]